MIVCEAQLRCLFRDYNDMYFDGIMEMPDFEIIHSTTYFGYFKSDIRNGTTLNPVIQISDKYEYTPSQLRSILVHEMIHYYLAYTGQDIVGSHGSDFLRIAKRLNKEYKLNITVTINSWRYKKRHETSLVKRIIAKLF